MNYMDNYFNFTLNCTVAWYEVKPIFYFTSKYLAMHSFVELSNPRLSRSVFDITNYFEALATSRQVMSLMSSSCRSLAHASLTKKS